jgi:hypothetical protein
VGGEADEVTYECEYRCGFEDDDFALVEAHEAACAKKTCLELGCIKRPTKRKRKRLVVPAGGDEEERAVEAVVAPAPAGDRGAQKRKKRRQAGGR